MLTIDEFWSTLLLKAEVSKDELSIFSEIPIRIGETEHMVNLGQALFNLEEAYQEYQEAYFAWHIEPDTSGLEEPFLDYAALPPFLRRQAM